MRAVISVPKKIITGAFNIRVSLPKDVTDFTAAHLLIETVSGDGLGHAKDAFGGTGRHYHWTCYLPDVRTGTSRISLVGTVDGEPLLANPIDIVYDTVKTVTAAFGTPVREGSKLTLPFSVGTAIVGLTKKHFVFEQLDGESLARHRFQLYGQDAAYELVLTLGGTGRFAVSVRNKPFFKLNGIQVSLTPVSVEV